MIETNSDLWTHGDIKVITTNGEQNNKGHAIMGRGIALEAKLRYPGIEKILGNRLELYGNIPHIIHLDPIIVSFPTKYHWKDKSDLELIHKSALRLRDIADAFEWRFIVMPKPGCGNGGLEWNVVKSAIRCLDDRFYICQK